MVRLSSLYLGLLNSLQSFVLFIKHLLLFNAGSGFEVFKVRMIVNPSVAQGDM
jgi:hypothetical protein